MSQASELLDNLTDEEVAAYSTEVVAEEHIVIDSNRNVIVPESLKRIAVQRDHNVKTVTFDCPRYWNGRDLSTMKIFVNYLRSDKYKDSFPCENPVIDESDDSVIHFDWVITENATFADGTLIFLVCAKRVDEFGMLVNHWNSELCTDMYISEGMDCIETIVAENPDLITHLLTRMDITEAKTTEDAMIGYLEEYLTEDKKMGQMIRGFVVDYLSSDSAVNDTLDQYIEKYIGTIEKTTDSALIGSVEGGLKINRILGKSVQNGNPTPDSPVAIESVSGNVQIKTVGKNLLHNTIGTYTVEGITYEERSDGSVTINGTATGTSCYTMDFASDIPFYERDLIASLEGGNGKVSMAVGFWYENGTAKDTMVLVSKNEQTFQYPPEAHKTRTYLVVAQGTTISNLTVYPMIRLAEVEDNVFDKYREKSVTVETPTGYLRGIKARYNHQANYIDKDGTPWITDEIDVERGVYIQRIATAVIDNTVTIGVGAHANGQKYCSYYPPNTLANSPVMCTNYKPSYWTNENGYAYIVGGTLVLADSRFTDADTCKSILQTERPSIIYALAEPIETPIDISQHIELNSLNTYAGASGIFTNDDLLTVEVQYGISAVGGLALENSNRIARESANIKNNYYTKDEVNVVGSSLQTQIDNVIPYKGTIGAAFNIDDTRDSGWYWCVISSETTGDVPIKSGYGVLEVIRPGGKAAGAGVQRFTSYMNNHVYVRMYVNGVWGAWVDLNYVATLADLGIDASATELNHMKGVTSGVQGQLDDLKKKDLRYGGNYTDLFSPTLSPYHEAWNKWVIVQGANIANAPVSGTVWFEVFTGGNQSAPRGFQIAISCFSSSRSIYIRWLHDSTWSGWEAFMTTTGNQNPSSLTSQGAKTSGGSWNISDTTLALYKYLTFALKDGDRRISLTRVPIDLVSTTSTTYVLNPLFGGGGDTHKGWGDVTIVKSGTTATITYTTRVQDACTISDCTLYLER